MFGRMLILGRIVGSTAGADGGVTKAAWAGKAPLNPPVYFI